MTSRLSRLPAYLRVQNGNNSDEEIENLEVNTINLTAALVDKVQQSGNYQNDWSVLEDYVNEFKLDEVMAGLVGRFDITDPKMLKGFQSSKGTMSDLKYVTKLLGIQIDIKDADYYANLGLVNMLVRIYPDLFWELESWGVTDERIISLMGVRIRKVNNRKPEVVDNVTPGLVINAERSTYEVLTLVGYSEPSALQIIAFDECFAKYMASVSLSPDESDCSIIVSIKYDMDSSSFDPGIVNDLSHIVNLIVNNRLLPHIRVQGYTMNLSMSDTVRSSNVVDGGASVSISRVVQKVSYDNLSVGADVYDVSEVLNYRGAIGATFRLEGGRDLWN